MLLNSPESQLKIAFPLSLFHEGEGNKFQCSVKISMMTMRHYILLLLSVKYFLWCIKKRSDDIMYRICHDVIIIQLYRFARPHHRVLQLLLNRDRFSVASIIGHGQISGSHERLNLYSYKFSSIYIINIWVYIHVYIYTG